jgi:hypothetical protein
MDNNLKNDKSDTKCYGNINKFTNPIIVAISAHLVQLITIIMVIFYFDKKKQGTSYNFLYGGYYIIPFLLFIYIAIDTGIISHANPDEPCYLSSKIWLMADCMVFAFQIPEFFHFRLIMNEKNLKDEVMVEFANNLKLSFTSKGQSKVEDDYKDMIDFKPEIEEKNDMHHKNDLFENSQENELSRSEEDEKSERTETLGNNGAIHLQKVKSSGNLATILDVT